MVAWTNSTPYNSRLDDYCMPITKRVSQAPFCGGVKTVTDKGEEIEASFAPPELLTALLALLANIIQRRKIGLKFRHADAIIHTLRLTSLISSLFLAQHEMSCSFVKTVFRQLL